MLSTPSLLLDCWWLSSLLVGGEKGKEKTKPNKTPKRPQRVTQEDGTFFQVFWVSTEKWLGPRAAQKRQTSILFQSFLLFLLLGGTFQPCGIIIIVIFYQREKSTVLLSSLHHRHHKQESLKVAKENLLFSLPSGRDNSSSVTMRTNQEKLPPLHPNRFYCVGRRCQCYSCCQSSSKSTVGR